MGSNICMYVRFSAYLDESISNFAISDCMPDGGPPKNIRNLSLRVHLSLQPVMRVLGHGPKYSQYSPIHTAIAPFLFLYTTIYFFGFRIGKLQIVAISEHEQRTYNLCGHSPTSPVETVVEMWYEFFKIIFYIVI